MKTAPIWALIQGQVFQPTPCQPVPPPPHPSLQGKGSLNVSDRTAYGPMTHGAARSFASALPDCKTLCIIAGGGWQAVWITDLALHLVIDALDHLLPGMMFFPDDGGGIILIGYGEPFENVHAADVIASCTPGIAFPVGRVWVAPYRYSRNANIRQSKRENWTPPNMGELEDLKPLVEFLRVHATTDKDQADFHIAESLRVAKDKQEIEANAAWWAARREAGETTINERKFLP